MVDTIQVDETLVDIANNMYAISNELADAKMKFEQAISILDEHYVNSQAQDRFDNLYNLFTDRLGSLVEIYGQYSNYCWYVLSTMLDTDFELASKVYYRMLDSLPLEEAGE